MITTTLKAKFSNFISISTNPLTAHTRPPTCMEKCFVGCNSHLQRFQLDISHTAQKISSSIKLDRSKIAFIFLV